MITREKIHRLKEMTAEIKKQKDIASEQLRIAKDRYGHIKHKLMREGKEIEVTENVLWEEVFYLGTGSEAAKILGEKHKNVFECYQKQNDVAAELKKFTIAELGMDYEAMTLSDYLNLTEGMFELMLKEHEMKLSTKIANKIFKKKDGEQKT